MTMTSPRPLAQASYFHPIQPDDSTTRPLDIMADHGHHLSDSEEYADNGASASTCIISPRGLFRVFHFHSFEGHGGVPVAVSVNFTFRPSETTFLRLVIGRKALNTAVRQVGKGGLWELEAIVPHMESGHHEPAVVPITAQALTTTNGVLDAVTVGSYTYWSSGRTSLAALDSSERPHLAGSHPQPPLVPRQQPLSTSLPRSHSYADSMRPERQLSSSPSDIHSLLAPRSRPPVSRSSSTRVRSAKALASVRQSKKQALMRTRRFGPGEESPASHRAVLEILTPLESMCSGWEEDEFQVGRRLVRFRRVQDGFRLKLSCESIKQEEYIEGDYVISCIYRRDTDSCYVTSVDIIALLEHIVGDAFEIEEKNRIRRNLEGFRPKTVSKNRAGSESFFQQIMDFPAPKPRNIEKDVKVFEWSILPQALEKIIAKYSLYYTSDPGDGMSSSPSPDFTTHSGSPRGFPRFASPSNSSSDIPSEAGDDTYMLGADFVDAGPGDVSYGSRSALHHTLSYTSGTPMGSYTSLPETSSLSGLPSSGGDHSDNPQAGFDPVYRIIPSTQSSFSDMTMPPSHLFHPAEHYHAMEARIRSPVPYF